MTMDAQRPGTYGMAVYCTIDSGGGEASYLHQITDGNADGAFVIDASTGAVSQSTPPQPASPRTLTTSVDYTPSPPTVTSCTATGNTITNFAVPWTAGVTDGGGNTVN